MSAGDTSFVAPDSLRDTTNAKPPDSTTDSLVGPAKIPARWTQETHAALLWSIYDMSRINDWENSVETSLKADSIRIDRGFESFNNSFSPALGWGIVSPGKRFLAELQTQFIWLSKRISYTRINPDSTRLSGREKVGILSLPVVLSISTAIPESLFSVTGFERVEAGVCGVAVPWARLRVDGAREGDFSATGHGLGFGLRLAIGRRLSSRLFYRGELRYLSIHQSSFNRDGIKLLESDLAGGTDKDAFSLNQQILQFQLQIVFGNFNQTSAPNFNNR